MSESVLIIWTICTTQQTLYPTMLGAGSRAPREMKGTTLKSLTSGESRAPE